MTGKKEIDFNRIHYSLAGSGDPWSSLTRTRVSIMKELHDGFELSEIASGLDLSLEELNAEIQPLLAASLLFESNGQFKPSFLIADESESQLVYTHAASFSKKLAITVEENLDDMRKSFNYLDLSKEYNFEDLEFLLIGGRIIDIKLLDKLSAGSVFMPPAPSRPSPDRPDARYYFWMIEGEKKHLGEYGLDDYDLPWSSWHYFSFGQNLIDGQPNPDRGKMEKKYSELIESGDIESPETLASNLKIPVVSASDSMKWNATSEEQAENLAIHFKENEKSIKELHRQLKSGQFAPYSLGEFLCWYAHIAYSVTIDILESKGILSVPPKRFQSAIWYNEQEQEGLLVG